MLVKRIGQIKTPVVYQWSGSSSSPIGEKSAYAASSVLDGAVITYDPYRVKGWRALISRGQYAGSDMYVTDESYVPCDFVSIFDAAGVYPGDPTNTVQFDHGGCLGDLGVYLSRPDAPNLDDLLRLDNKALSSMASNVASAQHSFQGGVFLGELGETIRMIRHPLEALSKGLTKYMSSATKRAISTKSLKKRADIVAQTWLEYSYGWKPLVQDIRDGSKALAQLAYRPPRQGVRAGSSLDIPVSSTTGSLVLGGSKIDYRIDNIKSLSVHYHAVVSLPRDSNTVLSDFGVDFRSFIPTVWNLIPYSFLVDYFTNIGAIADSMSINYAGVRFGIRGRKCESRSTLTIIGYNTAQAGAYWMKSIPSQSFGGPAIWSRTLLERTLYNASFTPPFQFQAPSLLSKRWINIAALGIANKEAVRRISHL